MRFALLFFSPFSRLVCRAKRALYARGILRARVAPIPVISVGNIAFGGSGKTPLSVEIAAGLLAGGERPALVSRGYKGTWEKGGGIVSDGRAILASWRESGDEPYMAALRLPGAGVFVGRDRLASCRRAAGLGFTCAILDDGFQHLRLARDVNIVLVDPEEKLALREGFASLGQADIIVARRVAGSADTVKLSAAFPGSTVTSCLAEAVGFMGLDRTGALPPDAFRGRRVFAFSGIAAPRRFFGLLESLGATVAGSLAFPDHFSYPEKALARIADAARAAGVEAVVTTEKDAVKIAPSGALMAGLPFFFLRIGLDLEPKFREALRAGLETAKARRGSRR
jgi:tetraacyldisaccharide 4'-kinase